MSKMIRRNVLKGLLASVAGVMSLKPTFASVKLRNGPSEKQGVYSVQSLSVVVAIDGESEDCIAEAQAKALKQLARSAIVRVAASSEVPDIEMAGHAISLHGERRLIKCVVASKRYWIPQSYMSYSRNGMLKVFAA